MTGKNKFSYGIDGCSGPTPFLTLEEIAKLFQELGLNKFSELTTTYNLMTKHPYLIAGKNRFDTDFNKATNGRGITKIGGEGIRGMVLKTKKYGIVGIAQKVLDGNQRVNDVAIMTILNHLDLLQPSEKEKLQKYKTKKLFNHNKIYIGDIRGLIS